jgi:capsular polysaccharide biosynthesis protein
LYVNNSTENGASTVTSGDITASKSLVETYITIIRSDTVLDEVVYRAGLLYSPSVLNKMLTAGALNSTEVFYITITNPNPTIAANLANAISDVAPRYLMEIVDGSSVKVVDKAKIPTEPSSPDMKKNIAIGALVGLFLACAVIVLVTVLDARINSESDLKSVSDLPILGVISDFQSASKSDYGYAKPPDDETNDNVESPDNIDGEAVEQ